MKTRIFFGLPPQAMQVRQTVFVQEQGFRDEFDEIDAHAAHIVLLDGETPVGVCRVFQEGQSYVLGRLAVVKEYRQKHLGSLLVRSAEDYVRSRGGTQLRLHAQCRAAEFYSKLGYVEFGEIEYEEGCPHIWMKNEL